MADLKKSGKTRACSKSAGSKGSRVQLSSKPSKEEGGMAHLVKHSSNKDDKLSTRQPEKPTVEQDTFTVANHGNKVTLPSKWSRLHTALSKLADEKMELRSKMNGDHFVERLQQQGGDSDINHVMVIQAQLLATIDDITSIPVEQWTISNKTTWQALYRVQHHLELIQQCMTLLGRRIKEQPIVTVMQTTQHQHSQQVPLLNAVTYSSLKGLLEYVEGCVTLQYKSCELAIAQLCQKEVIPALLDTTMATVDLTTTIRHICSILEKSRDTVFLYEKFY